MTLEVICSQQMVALNRQYVATPLGLTRSRAAQRVYHVITLRLNGRGAAAEGSRHAVLMHRKSKSTRRVKV